jgi:hypothetical protein
LINNRQNGRRRGRGGAQVRGPGGNGSDRGNRIDNRARGNAAQLHEKYRNLARDAQTQGDRVMTEYYLQFADHYFRVLNENRARFEDQNPHQNQQRRPRFENDEFEEGGDEGEGGEEAAESEQPRREEREPRRQERQGQDRQDRQDREPRRREREPVAAEAEAPREEVSEDEGDRRPRRGRRPRRAEGEAQAEGAPQRIEIDRLPPAFGSSDDEGANGHAAAPAEGDAGDEPAPRRRRTRRVATPNEDSPVAA